MKEKKEMPFSSPRSPLDLWRMMGGEARKVRSHQPATDSMLAVYQDRLTYTFILGDEVASIHFDRRKQEIFFKGHNIKNLELEPDQLQALEGLKEVLAREERGQVLHADYCATLDKVLADKR